MAIIKPAGAPPAFADPLRKEIRRDLRAHDREVLHGSLAAAKAKAATDAAAELAALGPVRDLDAADYQRAKRAALKLMRRVDGKP
jgi:hypothetical protein